MKVRDGTTCEVKVRTGREPIRAAGGSGWVERWRKRSVPRLPGLVDGTTLVEVVKHRRLVTIDGCQVELTEVSIAGRTWHSLALEANDSPPGSTTLEPVVARLANAGLGRFMELTADRSHGYAQHLLMRVRRRRVMNVHVHPHLDDVGWRGSVTASGHGVSCSSSGVEESADGV